MVLMSVYYKTTKGKINNITFTVQNSGVFRDPKSERNSFSVAVLQRTVNSVTTNHDTRVTPKAVHKLKDAP